MRAAPPVTCQSGLQGFWGWLALTVGLVATGAWVAWLVQTIQILGLPALLEWSRGLAATCALLTLLWAAYSLVRAHRSRWMLSWTGRQWLLQPANQAVAPWAVHQLVLCVDLGEAMLLRVHSGAPDQPVCWLPVTRGAGAADWTGLRVAVLFERGQVAAAGVAP